MVGMGVRSLTPGGYREFSTLQTLRAVYVAVRRMREWTFRCEREALLFTAFKGLGNLLDLERSQKVDLVTYRFQGPIRSLSLEGKGLRRAPIGVITIIYLVN